MTKAEIETIQNIVARLKEPNLGCGHGPGAAKKVEALNLRDDGSEIVSSASRIEAASRIYLDTWIIGALECLLPGNGRDPELAVKLSRK